MFDKIYKWTIRIALILAIPFILLPSLIVGYMFYNTEIKERPNVEIPFEIFTIDGSPVDFRTEKFKVIILETKPTEEQEKIIKKLSNSAVGFSTIIRTEETLEEMTLGDYKKDLTEIEYYRSRRPWTFLWTQKVSETKPRNTILISSKEFGTKETELTTKNLNEIMLSLNKLENKKIFAVNEPEEETKKLSYKLTNIKFIKNSMTYISEFTSKLKLKEFAFNFDFKKEEEKPVITTEVIQEPKKENSLDTFQEELYKNDIVENNQTSDEEIKKALELPGKLDKKSIEEQRKLLLEKRNKPVEITDNQQNIQELDEIERKIKEERDRNEFLDSLKNSENLLEQEPLETEEPQLEMEQEELNTVPDLIVDPRDGEKTPEEVFGAYEDYLNNNNTEENK